MTIYPNHKFYSGRIKGAIYGFKYNNSSKEHYLKTHYTMRIEKCLFYLNKIQFLEHKKYDEEVAKVLKELRESLWGRSPNKI